jgi:response regulator RpfG family c-di-GMP phosphodiesterase
MQFVNNGLEALQTLERAPYDVVVSDMRMPGMDGANLLKEVQDRFPHIVRIVLSGQSDQVMIEQARGATHQYLAKPCRPDTLKATISRACQLRELLANEELRGLAAGMSAVPTLPTLYRQLLAAYKQHPFMGADLVAAIPRMKPVAEIIRFQDKPYRASEGSNDPHAGEGLPIGARILKVALDFDGLLSSGKPQASAITVLKGRKDQYDPQVLEALIASLTTDVKVKVLSVGVAELQDGMILVEDVHATAGELLASKGQAVNPSMRMRFHNLGTSATIKEPLLVVWPKPATPAHSDPGKQAVSRFVQKLKAS